MKLRRIAAFAVGAAGGNPAGVWVGQELPPATEMQRIATEVGYSETAFAAPASQGWRVRYFSPRNEVPFCGHATIALGAALAQDHGPQIFPLRLNDDVAISVEGRFESGVGWAALQSPPTRSAPLTAGEVRAIADLFGLTAADLDTAIPPARIHGGADHLLLTLRSRERLAAMRYDQKAGEQLMQAMHAVTIALMHVRDSQHFDARNAFASGGIYEDPATGAAAAAFAGYLRDLNWPHCGAIWITQGEDMGLRSLIRADIPQAAGTSIRISGDTRTIS